MVHAEDPVQTQRRQPEFPTSIHRRAAEAIIDFSIWLIGRGRIARQFLRACTATPESDLDIALLIDPELPGAKGTNRFRSGASSWAVIPPL